MQNGGNNPHFSVHLSWIKKQSLMRNPWLLLFLLPLLVSCRGEYAEGKLLDLPPRGEQGLHAVIEIPAGTNHKVEYDKLRRTFAVDQRDGRDRVINFLPYPGNYGFIPSTFMDPARGGDGDALDILVLAETVPTGRVMECLPIGALLLRDEGAIDTKIIAVPADPAQRTIQVDNFQDFLIHYDAARRMIQEWFMHYDEQDRPELIRWEDEKFAEREVEKWTRP